MIWTGFLLTLHTPMVLRVSKGPAPEGFQSFGRKFSPRTIRDVEARLAQYVEVAEGFIDEKGYWGIGVEIASRSLVHWEVVHVGAPVVPAAPAPRPTPTPKAPKREATTAAQAQALFRDAMTRGDYDTQGSRTGQIEMICYLCNDEFEVKADWNAGYRDRVSGRFFGQCTPCVTAFARSTGWVELDHSTQGAEVL